MTALVVMADVAAGSSCGNYFFTLQDSALHTVTCKRRATPPLPFGPQALALALALPFAIGAPTSYRFRFAVRVAKAWEIEGLRRVQGLP